MGNSQPTQVQISDGLKKMCTADNNSTFTEEKSNPFVQIQNVIITNGYSVVERNTLLSILGSVTNLNASIDPKTKKTFNENDFKNLGTKNIIESIQKQIQQVVNGVSNGKQQDSEQDELLVNGIDELIEKFGEKRNQLNGKKSGLKERIGVLETVVSTKLKELAESNERNIRNREKELKQEHSNNEQVLKEKYEEKLKQQQNSYDSKINQLSEDSRQQIQKISSSLKLAESSNQKLDTENKGLKKDLKLSESSIQTLKKEHEEKQQKQEEKQQELKTLIQEQEEKQQELKKELESLKNSMKNQQSGEVVNSQTQMVLQKCTVLLSMIDDKCFELIMEANIPDDLLHYLPRAIFDCFFRNPKLMLFETKKKAFEKFLSLASDDEMKQKMESKESTFNEIVDMVAELKFTASALPFPKIHLKWIGVDGVQFDETDHQFTIAHTEQRGSGRGNDINEEYISITPVLVVGESKTADRQGSVIKRV